MAFKPLACNGKTAVEYLGEKSCPVGGDNCFSFHFFEGARPSQPLLALEVWDIYPREWPDVCCQAYGRNLSSPLDWAAAALAAGAQAIALQLKSIDPNGLDAGPEPALGLVGELLDKIDVPLIVWGCDNAEKDALVLSTLAARYAGRKLILGPVEEANHKRLAPLAAEYGHTICATTPIDVNLAKQLNILLQNQGVPLEKILIDPTTGGLGYGLEYTYSVMERLRIAALQQNDQVLALPLICHLGKEIWKSKEARQLREEAPEMGEDNRGVFMEISAGVSLLLAGANILVLGHPQSLRGLRDFIDLLFSPAQAENELWL
ncbi:MAG: acetyl-CoA decarbonylase/synthase complex subunit delta [Desulfarculales bacterium]|jgi:acetyl-CoA decarbonylase/synthase complex subunit delta|nr:acetyl-CoA decarbonylase/synthase complex subunit delta [Desulfarculales bacterium]